MNAKGFLLLPFVLAGSALFVAPAAHAAETGAEQRIAELDARIRALEEDARKLREQAAEALSAAQAARADLERMRVEQGAARTASVVAPAPPPAAAGANNNAFNPAISMILDGTAGHHSLDEDRWSRSGFPLVGEGGPLPQGFALGESEITFSANIDDKFYGQLTVALESDGGDTEVGIEEAFIDTNALPDGFTLRAGRFFSNIGYLNSHHAHTDSFIDRPLAYQAFLGGQYGDDGVQLRWVAPLDWYLELGGELLRGDGYPAGGAAHDGVGARSVFAHAGGDVGSDDSWLAGISLLRTDPRDGEDGFSGANTLTVLDFTWKHAPNGNTKDGGVTVRGEAFDEKRNGIVALDDEADAFQPWRGHRRGAYLETVFRLNRRWDLGYRYDRLWSAGDGPYAADHDPDRHTAELTWRNSEFSLFRLQLSRERPTTDQYDNALYLQYQVSLGAHGAHKF